MNEKLILTKTYRSYYTARNSPAVVEFGPVGYLAIQGRGAPAGSEFALAVEALYPLAYAVKKQCKNDGRDFAVPNLEGLWWIEGERSVTDVSREEWSWKLLIRMPEFVSSEMVASLRPATATSKKNNRINDVKYELFPATACVQMLHVGPYATEPTTIATLLTFIAENDLVVDGLHHEIYLSDPRKTEPEEMKTIIRYPVRGR